MAGGPPNLEIIIINHMKVVYGYTTSIPVFTKMLRECLFK